MELAFFHPLASKISRRAWRSVTKSDTSRYKLQRNDHDPHGTAVNCNRKFAVPEGKTRVLTWRGHGRMKDLQSQVV